jgi:hypothetical protein
MLEEREVDALEAEGAREVHAQCLHVQCDHFHGPVSAALDLLHVR